MIFKLRIKLKEQKEKKGFEGYLWIRWRWLFLIIDKIADSLEFEDIENWWLRVIVKKRIKK